MRHENREGGIPRAAQLEAVRRPPNWGLHQVDMDPGTDFEARFESRKERWASNLEELYRELSPHVLDPFASLAGLVPKIDPGQPLYALRWSILTLWLEATHCYVLGQFQASILASGAVVERVLKLEYQEGNGPLPAGVWTLGKCAFKLDLSKTRVSAELLSHARECVDPKNDRAHALLEHKDPTAAVMGGDRGIYPITPNRYLIEPFRGEALNIASRTWSLLHGLYAKGAPHAVGDA